VDLGVVVAKKSVAGAAAVAKVASVFGADNEEEEEEEKAPKFDLAPHVSYQKGHATNATGVKRKEHSQDIATGVSKKIKTGAVDTYRSGNWLYRNIVVRIISKTLADGKYFKRKAVVDKVIDKYTAEVEVLDSGPDKRDGGDILKLDQDDLETVIPKEAGTKVRVLNGKYRGEKARVEELDKRKYQATLRLIGDNRILESVRYEDFSKLA
jgi:DNA/RNA-binding protein KIN17